MPSSGGTQKSPERYVVVVFDTNVLYTDMAHHLLRLEVKELIKTHSDHSDVHVEWMLPEGVIEERRYQMVRAASVLQRHVQNFSQLLGTKIECNDEQLASHVDRCIREGLKELNLKSVSLEGDTVNWAAIQRAAWHREPPFEDSAKKEKGFRDALILETFTQIVGKAHASAIVVLHCGDEMLATTVTARFAGHRNVRVFSDISEVSGLINTFVENVTEEHVERIAKKAAHMFYDPADSDRVEALWIKWGLSSKVNSVFNKASDWQELDTPEQTSYKVMSPVLLQKSGIRWRWLSRFVKVYTGSDKSAQAPLGTAPLGSPETSVVDAALSLGTPEIKAPRALSSILSSVFGSKARITRHVDVTWEVGVTSNERMREPKLISIELGSVSRESA